MNEHYLQKEQCAQEQTNPKETNLWTQTDERREKQKGFNGLWEEILVLC